MKHLKKLLAALLVVAMVIAMVPAVFAADSGDAAETAMDSIWADIDAMYAATATKDGKAADPVATAQKALRSSSGPTPMSTAPCRGTATVPSPGRRKTASPACITRS